MLFGFPQPAGMFLPCFVKALIYAHMYHIHCNRGTQWCKHSYQTSVHKPVKHAETPCCSPQQAPQCPTGTCRAPDCTWGAMCHWIVIGTRTVRVTSGLLPDKNQHSHNAPASICALARALHGGYLLQNLFPMHLIFNVFLCIITLPEE